MATLGSVSNIRQDKWLVQNALIAKPANLIRGFLGYFFVWFWVFFWVPHSPPQKYNQPTTKKNKYLKPQNQTKSYKCLTLHVWLKAVLCLAKNSNA